MGQFIITQLTLVFPTNTSVRRFIEMGSDKANTQGLGNKVEHSRMPTNFANFLLILHTYIFIPMKVILQHSIWIQEPTVVVVPQVQSIKKIFISMPRVIISILLIK